MLRPLRLLWLDTCMKGGKIYVGLSGGVDSAVSAALLLKAGAQVIGVFIKGWYPSGMPCTWAEDRRDAMRVAARLGIPFMTLDASAEYKKGVIDYLLGEYAAGRTPNPDVMCNREVKFGAFYDYARAHGADALLVELVPEAQLVLVAQHRPDRLDVGEPAVPGLQVVVGGGDHLRVDADPRHDEV